MSKGLGCKAVGNNEEQKGSQDRPVIRLGMRLRNGWSRTNKACLDGEVCANYWTDEFFLLRKGSCAMGHLQGLTILEKIKVKIKVKRVVEVARLVGQWLRFPRSRCHTTLERRHDLPRSLAVQLWRELYKRPSDKLTRGCMVNHKASGQRRAGENTEQTGKGEKTALHPSGYEVT